MALEEAKRAMSCINGYSILFCVLYLFISSAEETICFIIIYGRFYSFKVNLHGYCNFTNCLMFISYFGLLPFTTDYKANYPLQSIPLSIPRIAIPIGDRVAARPVTPSGIKE